MPRNYKRANFNPKTRKFLESDFQKVVKKGIGISQNTKYDKAHIVSAYEIFLTLKEYDKDSNHDDTFKFIESLYYPSESKVSHSELEAIQKNDKKFNALFTKLFNVKNNLSPGDPSANRALGFFRDYHFIKKENDRLITMTPKSYDALQTKSILGVKTTPQGKHILTSRSYELKTTKVPLDKLSPRTYQAVTNQIKKKKPKNPHTPIFNKTNTSTSRQTNTLSK